MTEGASTLMDMRLLAAQAVAREAGAMARRRFLDQSFTVGFKGPQDFLTEVDGETEAFIARASPPGFSERRVHRRREQGPPGGRGRRGVGRRSDRRHGELRARRAAFLRVDRLRRRGQGRGRRHLRSDARRIVRRPARRRRAAQRRADARVERRTRSPVPQSRSAGTCVRAPTIMSTSCGGSSSTGAAPFRTGSGALALAYVARRPARRLCRASYPCVGLSRRDPAGQRGGRLCERLSCAAAGSPRALRSSLARRGSRTPLSLPRLSRALRYDRNHAHSWRRARDDRASRRRGAKLADRRTRPLVAGRPGDLERHQSDPLSGRRLDARRRGAGRRRHAIRSALHGFARFETFAVETSTPDFARLTLSDNSRTRAIYPFAFALALEYRLTADALAIAIEVANPGEKRAPYACGLHPGFRWPLGAGGTRRRARPVRKGGAARGSGTRAGRTCSRDDAPDPPLRPQSAAVRRPVRPRRAVLPRLREPVAHLRRRLGGVDHDGI